MIEQTVQELTPLVGTRPTVEVYLSAPPSPVQ